MQKTNDVQMINNTKSINDTRITCIGQAVVDCITRGKEEQPHKKNVYRADHITLSTGGDALNESVILSNLGCSVKLVCGIGDDLAGHLILEEARVNGVDTSRICIRSDITTPIANLMVNQDGTRVSVNSQATMLGDYVPEVEVVKGAAIVSLASLFRAPLDQKETIIALAKAAKAEGAILCADTKIPTYRTLSLSDIEEILPLIDYIFPNENEGEYYTGKTDYMEMAHALREKGVKNVIIKTGAKGCTVSGETDEFVMPAADVTAVDSTGAGDNFVAGFMAGLLEGKSLRGCCEQGTSCAAICVGEMGATAGIKNCRSKGRA